MTLTASSALFLIVSIFAATHANADTIKIDGSSTVFPITEAIAEEFRTTNKKTKVTIGVSGTGGGFKKFANGEIDINNASRPFKDTEIAAAAKKGINFYELPIAFDGLSVIVNKKNSFANSITIDQLKKIWEPGSKINTWKDVNPAWPDKKIALYGPGPDSGTFDYFTEEVVGTPRAMRSDFSSSEDDHVIVNGVSGDEFALGYLGFAYYQENTGKLKALSVDKGKGPILGDDKTISDGTYPLSRPVFIVVSSKAAERKEVKEFVNYYLKNAAKLSKEVGYTALPASMYTEAAKRFETGKTGNWMTTSH